MNHITDPDLLTKMAQLEGQEWAFGRPDCTTPAHQLLGVREIQLAIAAVEEAQKTYQDPEMAPYWDEH